MSRGRVVLALGVAAGTGAVLTVVLVHRVASAAPPASNPTGAVIPQAVTAEPVPVATAGSCHRRSVSLGGPRLAYAVTVVHRATAYRAPGSRPFAHFSHLNVNGVPTVLGVRGARLDGLCRPTWFHVQLPLRPNGITGWVRARDVTEQLVRTRIVVDLSARRVTLFERGRPVLVVTAAIGSPATPTPMGRFYVNQKLVASDPQGPFGPAALGISAFSPVLTSWVQGGPIAIHGTNEADLVGAAVSHGCVRLRNADLVRLYQLVPEGTPVLIRM